MLNITYKILPEVLVDYFELTHHKIKGEDLHFHFKEKNENCTQRIYYSSLLKNFSRRGLHFIWVWADNQNFRVDIKLLLSEIKFRIFIPVDCLMY